jgi:hypothetical protein
MATLDVEEPILPGDSPVVVISQRALRAAGADERLNFRALLALALTAACVVLAPLPFNVIGAVSCAITAIEVARLAWHK